MTDEQILEVVDDVFGHGHYEVSNPDWIRFARALLAASAPNPSYTDFETWLKGPHARVQTMLDAFDAGKRLANPSVKQEAEPQTDAEALYEAWSNAIDTGTGVVKISHVPATEYAAPTPSAGYWYDRERIESENANPSDKQEAKPHWQSTDDGLFSRVEVATPLANPSDKQAHAIDCEYIQNDSHLVECTCGFANPSDKKEADPPPTGFASWKDAALDERMKRVALQKQIAQSAEQDRIDAELFQRLLHARSELGRTIADPMWPDHGEVTKAALKRWHSAIDEVIKGASK